MIGKNKRILILNYEFPPLGGGGGVAAQKLAKGFIEHGYEVDYVTTGFAGLPKFEKIDGINVHRVRVIGRKELPTASMISLYSYPLFALPKAMRLCSKYRYEFINSHFVVPSGLLGMLVSKWFSLKHILSLIGGDIYDPTKKSSPHRSWLYRLLLRTIINQADYLTAISSDTADNARKYYDIDRKIEVIHIPYEPISFTKVSRKSLGLEENKKYVVGVGRLVKRKGFDFFIEVLAKLPNSVEGIILGGGPERKNLEKLAKQLKVNHRLRLPGFVSEEQKMQYLDNSDVFFLSSRHEGFGIVLQEAMQVGLSIVATDNGGQRDFVSSEDLVGFGEVDITVDKIMDKMVAKTNEYDFLKKNSLKMISEKYLSYLL